MTRPGRLRTALLWTIVIFLLLGAGAVIGARFYLSSGSVKERVAARLQSLLGGKVQVGAADIGLAGDSTLKDIEVFQDADRKDEKPWLKVADVDLDVSALDLTARKAMPDKVRLRGAEITLRFDRHGHLLTELPSAASTGGKVPAITIDGGTITLDQDGHVPMVIKGIKAEVDGSANPLKLTGTIDDPFWGRWDARASYDRDNGAMSLALDTPEVEVTQEKLNSIAFVPAKVWEQVQIPRGLTPAKVRIDFAKDRPGVHYRVDLQPRDTRVALPSIHLDADQASGKVVIEDELVTLTGVRGRMAKGTITTDATLDFRSAVTSMHFKVGVRDVDLDDLPSDWEVHQLNGQPLHGRFTGNADLLVTITRSGVETRGGGKGEVTNGLWGRIPVKRLTLELQPTGKGIRFPDKSAALPVPASALVALVLLAAPPPPDRKPEDPYSLGNLLTAPPRAIGRLTRKVVDVAGAGLKRLDELRTPPKPGEKPTYLQLSLNLEDVDLAQLVEQLRVKLPFALSGRLTFDVQAAIPVNAAKDLKAYRFNGTATLTHLNVSGVELARVQARVRYADGVLRLEKLQGEMPPPGRAGTGAKPGTFAGSAVYEVVPPGDLSADLRVERIPLDRALALVPGLKDAAPQGTLSGNVNARGRADRLQDPAAWNGTASLRSDRLGAYGLALTDVTADLAVGGGRALLTDFKSRLEGGPLTGTAELALSGTRAYRGKVQLRRADLGAIKRLAPSFRLPFPVEGKVTLDADVQGTLSPPTVSVRGHAAADGLVVRGVKFDSLTFDWSQDTRVLKLSGIRAKLYQGEVTGSLLLPLAEAATGSADLRIKEVDLEALTRAVPDMPIQLGGKVSGTVKGTLQAAAGGKPRVASADVEVAAPDLYFRLLGRKVPAKRVKGSVEYKDGVASYNLVGDTLRGKFKLQGKLPAEPAPPADEEGGRRKKEGGSAPPPGSSTSLLPLPSFLLPLSATLLQAPGEAEGRFQLEGAHLNELWRVLGLRERLGPLDGVISVNLPFRHVGPGFTPVGDGRIEIRDIRWQGQDLADTVVADIRLTPGAAELRNIRGNLGGGALGGRVVYNLRDPSRSFFSLTLDAVDLARLLLPFPELAGRLQGTVAAHLRGRLRPEWRGDGTVVLTGARLLGVEVNEGRLPVDFTYAPRSGNGELDVRDGVAQLGAGRATLKASAMWGAGLRLQGSLNFYEANLRSLIPQVGEGGTFGAGRVSGRVDFGGAEIRSVNDLTATIQATLRQTQPMQLPVLGAVLPRLPGMSPSSTFENGDLRARLAGGLVRIQRLTLSGPTVRVVIEGTLTLQGLLNLEVTVGTGQVGLNPACLRLLGLRLPAFGPIPLTLIAEASTYLSNRLVHLRVTGTIRNPVVQVEPIRLLTEEAVRFFLNRANIPAP